VRPAKNERVQKKLIYKQKSPRADVLGEELKEEKSSGNADEFQTIPM
jgi:hypothetical protein